MPVNGGYQNHYYLSSASIYLVKYFQKHHFIFFAGLLGQWYYTHFTHEEVEVQEMSGQIPRSPRWSEASQD